MPRSALAPINAAPEGATVTLTAANVDGHSIPGGGGHILLVNNGGAGSINVTVQTPATVDGLAVAEQVVAVAAGQMRAIGPFRPTTYDRPVGAVDAGLVYVDFSGVTSVTCACLRV